jgi:protocatechuate 3,4-dioxygenase beta subunit
MGTDHLKRRDLLMKCAALGSLVVAPSLSIGDALRAWSAPLKPTPPNDLGPYYKQEAPLKDHLRPPGDPGLPLTVSGTVFDTAGNSLPGAQIEIWHADHLGRYDLTGFRYRAALVVGATGKYQFDSVMPGHYPRRVCQHVHYRVNAPGHKMLVTQLYFATDRIFDGDPDHNYTRDPLIHSRELVRPVTLTGDPSEIMAAVNFEIVLERL